jgi:hypothetical protein
VNAHGYPGLEEIFIPNVFQFGARDVEEMTEVRTSGVVCYGTVTITSFETFQRVVGTRRPESLSRIS